MRTGSQSVYIYGSSRPSLFKRLKDYIPFLPIRRCSEARSGVVGTEERAPSTADEFRRVAEEKARQGVAGQTVEKAEEAAEEATVREANLESFKEHYKEPVDKGVYHEKGDDFEEELPRKS